MKKSKKQVKKNKSKKLKFTQKKLKKTKFKLKSIQKRVKKPKLRLVLKNISRHFLTKLPIQLFNIKLLKKMKRED